MPGRAVRAYHASMIGGMTEVWDVLAARTAAGEPVALATVVATSGSAPREPGTVMVVTVDGAVVGSLSGGCVESDVYAVAELTLADGAPRLRSYGIPDSTAAAVGLTCGGTIEVFVERLDATSAAPLLAAAGAAAPATPATLSTVLTGPRAGRRFAAPFEPAPAADERVFVQTFVQAPSMYVFGANDFSAALVEQAALLGYRVTVCDHRPLFATRERVPAAAQVVLARPDEWLRAAPVDSRTAICVLAHAPQFDVALLRVALDTDAGYVGALGSRRTHAERVAALRAEGVDELALARLRGPIGLDLGARTPAQLAVSIVAELVAVTHGGSGAPLSQLDTPIHRDRAGSGGADGHSNNGGHSNNDGHSNNGARGDECAALVQ